MDGARLFVAAPRNDAVKNKVDGLPREVGGLEVGKLAMAVRMVGCRTCVATRGVTKASSMLMTPSRHPAPVGVVQMARLPWSAKRLAL